MKKQIKFSKFVHLIRDWTGILWLCCALFGAFCLPSENSIALCLFPTLRPLYPLPKAIETAASDYFSISPITPPIENRILGISYLDSCPVSIDELCYVQILHVGFDGLTHRGELIVHEQIAQDILAIFYNLYLARYPIEQIILIDEYGADDEASMAANNSSAFCSRPIAGSKTLSLHSYGMAVDINPLYNPYVLGDAYYPASSAYNPESMSVDSPYFMNRNDYCVQQFLSHGFDWGGDWDSPKDYQHFEYRGSFR